MATQTSAAPIVAADDLGLDREFVMSMARVPFIAAGFTVVALLSHRINPYAPVALLCLGMIVAAVIDGWKFKVPNWLTLPLVLSGWGIGLLHDFGIACGPGRWAAASHPRCFAPPSALQCSSPRCSSAAWVRAT
jgi:prepilin peptidase CpaA